MPGNNSTRTKRGNTDKAVSKDVVLGDLGESKQTAKRKASGVGQSDLHKVTPKKGKTAVNKKENGKKKRVTMNVAEISNSNVNPNLQNEIIEDESAVARMDQGSEYMALHVSRALEKETFPMEGDLDGNGESTESENEDEDNENLSGDNSQANVTDSDEEISFPSSSNNNAVLQEIKDREEEQMEADELKSMVRFANFLEKRGYIVKGKIQQVDKQAVDKPDTGNEGGRPIGPLQRLDKKNAANGSRKIQGKVNKVDKNPESIKSSNSEATVYNNAVVFDLENVQQPMISNLVNKRNSSSSEDNMEISDESGDEQVKFQNFVDARLSEYRKGVTGDVQDEQQPGTSGYVPPSRKVQVPQDETMEEHLDAMIRQAEAAKARMNLVSGKSRIQGLQSQGGTFVRQTGAFAHSLFVDEQYSVMAGHVDRQIKAKIVAGEYVDFAKLIPRDRVQDNEGLLQPVNKDGILFLQNANDRNSISISSFAKWEQAFRIFTHCYTEAYPKRGNELIQYNYIIHSAAQTFIWENVYAYDRDFRMHMSQFPDRSWAVILQQGWSMRLRDRLSFQGTRTNNGFSNNDRSGNNSNAKNSKVCWNYNRGRCKFGFNCKFDHKCALCGKFGHGSHTCRRANNGKFNQQSSNASPSSSYPAIQYDKETGEPNRRFEDKSSRRK